jgi:GntR family transcriptional regulator/MocR family aminotransferase
LIKQSKPFRQSVMVGRHSARKENQRRVTKLYAERQQVLLRAARRELNGLLELKPSDAGMHLIGWLREGVDDEAAARAAFAGGVEVTPLSAYCIEPQTRGALRLGYTGYTPREIWGAVRQLAKLLSVF